ncbi:MAG: glycosyltransferase family 1 protein [Merismopedia sp. SIO2A8]|nr:glycosyltransferase family 1 protein [Symploca sp. SIO2B6]NET52917.1 glycosyltransferase family 1 protein [Merismopedia sp. SIO2A8]
MATSNYSHIALISVHGDPAIDIGKEEAGGQNVYVRQVGEALAQLGWKVDLFTRRTSVEQPLVVEHAPNCRTIRLTAGPTTFIPRDDIFDYLPDFVEAFLQFQEEQSIQYKVVHSNYWLSSWVGMELKKRQPNIQQVHTYHSLGAVKYQEVDDIPPIANTRLIVEKECLETVARVVATSPQEQEHMRSLVSQKGSIDIIPCGTDIQRFGAVSRVEARQALVLDLEAQIVFYIGRFDPRKGIETLVRAMGQSKHRISPKLQLIIGGGSRPGRSDGDERLRIERIVTELEMEDMTFFPGRISDDDLPLYYAASDITVVPSHYEPFGLVAIEAMASGTPVIASDVGGLQFTVQSEATGLLVPARNDAAFSSAVDRILDNPVWQEKLGKAARQRVESYFSWKGVAEQLSELYKTLLENPDHEV